MRFKGRTKNRDGRREGKIICRYVAAIMHVRTYYYRELIIIFNFRVRAATLNRKPLERACCRAITPRVALYKIRRSHKSQESTTKVSSAILQSLQQRNDVCPLFARCSTLAVYYNTRSLRFVTSARREKISPILQTISSRNGGIDGKSRNECSVRYTHALRDIEKFSFTQSRESSDSRDSRRSDK